MEEHANSAAPSPPAPVSRPWPDHRWLALLFLLVTAFRIWQVCHTEVLARDSIGFVCLAWQLEHEPVRDVLRQAEFHPGYPLLILLAAAPLRLFGTWPEPVTLQMSAQLVSVAASILLILPMFYLGRTLFNGRVAFWACLLFQFLPSPARVLGDGLSEAAYLLFAVTALALAGAAVKRRSVWLFGLCGLSGGLAYLVRPEGALTVAAAGLVLLAAQAVAAWRTPWRRLLLCAGSLAVGAALVGVPSYALSGRLVMKPSGKILEASETPPPLLPENVPGAKEPLSGGATPGSPLWAVWWADYQKDWPVLDWRWGLWAVGYELTKGFHFVLWVPALFGLVWYWRRTAAEPAAWATLLVCLATLLLLLRLASTLGYVSDRHMSLVLLCGSFWVVAALEVVARGLVWVGGSRLTAWSRLSPDTLGRACGAGLVVIALGTAVPRLIEPLHSDRSGFREAGLWLAEHLGPEDAVFDPYRWTGYYAGQDFRAPVSLAKAKTRYVVLEEASHPEEAKSAEEAAAGEHKHLFMHEQAKRLRPLGQEVYCWSGKRGKKAVKIVIFTLPERS